jgi:hypothetical protein
LETLAKKRSRAIIGTHDKTQRTEEAAQTFEPPAFEPTAKIQNYMAILKGVWELNPKGKRLRLKRASNPLRKWVRIG